MRRKRIESRREKNKRKQRKQKEIRELVQKSGSFERVISPSLFSPSISRVCLFRE